MMNKEAYSPDRAYTQGWQDALASLSIGVSTYDNATTLLITSVNPLTGVMTVMAQARVKPDSGAVITL